MVAPVTGPYQRTSTIRNPSPSGFSPVWTTSSRTWFRQQRPYSLRLPYEVVIHRKLSQTYQDDYPSDVSARILQVDSRDIQRLYNDAYSDFMGKARAAQADVLTLMRERQKALSMIQNRALQLAVFVDAARKRNFRAMRSTVKYAFTSRDLKTKVGVRQGAVSTGGSILEASFGWAPLAADLSSAVQVFRKGPPGQMVVGQRSREFFSASSDLENNPSSFRRSSTRAGYALRATVRCVDSDIYLLNSLGLVNLASSFWETTPWSFAVDYFVNMQDFLNGFTDRLGLEFENATSTFFAVENFSETLMPMAGTNPPPWGGYASHTSQHVRLSRVNGISRPTLLSRAPWRLSPQRALTSIALLLQKLKG